METASVLGASFGASFSKTVPDGLDSRAGSRFLLCGSWPQRKPSLSLTGLGSRKPSFSSSRKQPVTRASIHSSDFGSSQAPIAPLQLESPVGQFLSNILMSHPHLVPAAVEQQLEQLQTDRQAEQTKQEPSASGTELVLYRRIAEVKANERRKVLEEILYALVVQKFMAANVPLTSSITQSPDSSNTWLSKDNELEKLHSAEAYEMIQNHLALIIGNRMSDSDAIAQISKLRVGQVYAASVMYGYFLKRVDQRFQLEKTMKILPQGGDDTKASNSIGEEVIASERRPGGDESFTNSQPHPEIPPSWSSNGSPFGIKPSRLRTYVMSLDGETIQRYATIRSKEAIGIIEKHTEALFGRPEIVLTPEGSIDSSKDEAITIRFAALKRLVLEAVTFGSFLWEVESFVDSRYHFVSN